MLAIATFLFFPTFVATENTLILLHVLFRHGNRTPDKEADFPLNIYKNETYEPIGYSQVTTAGKKTEYHIGTYMRQTYNSLIPAQYTPETVFAISTNYKRTKMSLELVLAGLFPPLETDKFDSDINWQPISFIVEEPRAYLGIAPLYCPNFLLEYFEYFMSDKGQSLFMPYRELFEYTEKYTGKKINRPEDICKVYSTLMSQKDWGFKLPNWTEKYFPDEMSKVCAIEFELETGTPILRQVAAGGLLKKIIEDTEMLINGTLNEERKAFLYSAHDWNVGVMLSLLGVSKGELPPYGATIFFEIHQLGQVFGLKLYYQDYTAEKPTLLTIPGCKEFCALAKFKELFKDDLPAVDQCTNSGEIV